MQKATKQLLSWATPVRILATLSFFAVLVWSIVTTLPDGRLHLSVCDVGQGDALVVRTPSGGTVVIDGGPDTEALECLGNAVPFWDRTVELAIATHPHLDHIAGLSEIIRRYRVEKVGLSGGGYESRHAQVFLEEVRNERAEVADLAHGNEIVVDGVRLRVLWPRGDTGTLLQDPNERSVVLLLSYGNFTALLTGDKNIGEEEEWGRLGPVTVLKVPHHGSRTALNRDAVRRFSPRVSVVSAGQPNRYGHPHEELLRLFQEEHLPLLRTDTHGTIEIVSDGLRFDVRVIRR